MPIIHEVEGVDCEWTVNPSLVKNRDANCKSIKKQKTSLVKKTGFCRYHCFKFRKKSPLIGFYYVRFIFYSFTQQNETEKGKKISFLFEKKKRYKTRTKTATIGVFFVL